MISSLAAVLLCAGAFAAPAPAPAVAASTAPAAALSPALALSTYTVSTLYTGDKVRDPFMPATVGGAGRARDKNAPLVVDIHSLELRGIMRDSQSAFALFSMDNGTTLILRGRRLYDERNKPVPGITGSINMKQKRAELITADKDRQPFQLGELDAGRSKEKPGAE
ncbi:MAG TPA: hypothetical protein VN915_00635 [Elusimicrobiota bacterium]|nr:hypothetical protein [Elusimicrobiota bacterium]